MTPLGAPNAGFADTNIFTEMALLRDSPIKLTKSQKSLCLTQGRLPFLLSFSLSSHLF